MSHDHDPAFRCLDPACGWQGRDSELEQRYEGVDADRAEWAGLPPNGPLCCPVCQSDAEEGSWCDTCGQRPAMSIGPECEPCFAETERLQDEIVRKHNEAIRIERIQNAVRTYHEYRKLRHDPRHKERSDELRAVLRDVLGLTGRKAS